jgi:hypothetical protein
MQCRWSYEGGSENLLILGDNVLNLTHERMVWTQKTAMSALQAILSVTKGNPEKLRSLS